MGILEQALENKRTAVILGHVNPDGDCIGSCLGLYNYLTENFEGLSVTVRTPDDRKCCQVYSYRNGGTGLSADTPTSENGWTVQIDEGKLLEAVLFFRSAGAKADVTISRS